MRKGVERTNSHPAMGVLSLKMILPLQAMEVKLQGYLVVQDGMWGVSNGYILNMTKFNLSD